MCQSSIGMLIRWQMTIQNTIKYRKQKKLTDMFLDDKIIKKTYDEKYDDITRKIKSLLKQQKISLLKSGSILYQHILIWKTETEFEKYQVIQDRLFMSNLDKFMLELEEKAK